LADQAEKEAAGQINEQRAEREGARRADLHQALQSVARQSACRAENCNQRETQFLSNLAGHAGVSTAARTSVNKKPLARVCQESSDPVNSAGTVMANSIAFRNRASV